VNYVTRSCPKRPGSASPRQAVAWSDHVEPRQSALFRGKVASVSSESRYREQTQRQPYADKSPGADLHPGGAGFRLRPD
jgi:hypothetical protein